MKVVAVCVSLLGIAGFSSAALPPVLPPTAGAGQAVASGPASLPLTKSALVRPGLPPLRTPRAHIILGSGRVNASDVLARNWRTGMSYFLRANLPGIVEYLFPFDGIFHAGQPLARVYDIGNITDWEKARQLLLAAGASPYLIAGGQPLGPQVYFPSAVVPVPNQPPISLPIFTAPAAQAPAPVAPRSRASLAKAPASQRDTRTSRASLARVAASQATEEEVVSYESAPAEQRKDYSSEIGAAKSEVTSADNDVEVARRQVSAAEDDLAARDRLYQKGIIARRDVDNARVRLDEARRGLARREATLAEARRDLRSVQAQAAQSSSSQVRRVVRRVSVPRATLASQPRSDVADSPQPSQAQAFPSPQSPAQTQRVAQRPAARRGSSRVVWPSPMVTARGVRFGQGGAATGALPAGTAPLSPMANQLSQVRCADQQSASEGVLVRAISPNGALVRQGDPLLEIANTEWVRLYADVDETDVPRFQPGTPVTVTFDDYPLTRFSGWVSDITPQRKTAGARAELVVFCENGLYGNDARYTIEWLALASPIDDDAASDHPQPLEPSPEAAKRQAALYQMFPFAPASVVDAVAGIQSDAEADVYSGSLQLGEMPRPAAGLVNRDTAAAQKRLAALRIWRDAFTRGMTTSSVAPGVSITYPRDGEVNVAIERMLRGMVSHVPNRCAGTMREALGWGLGDAHMWAYELPRVGYAARPAGLARPGDILVWPFTYGPRQTQHIGFAVQQNGKLMLLSNLSGNLGTTEILPGFIAYYRPVIASRPVASPAH